MKEGTNHSWRKQLETKIYFFFEKILKHLGKMVERQRSFRKIRSEFEIFGEVLNHGGGICETMVLFGHGK